MKSRTKISNASNSPVKNTACENSKQYPSISAAYWLPAPNTSPYLLPGIIICSLESYITHMIYNIQIFKHKFFSL
jgi:hypothetical protein